MARSQTKEDDMLNDPVLLLNSTYEPLNVINLKRAIRLLIGRKANSLETDGAVIKYSCGEIRIPSVVRLVYYVQRPHQRVKFTKQSVLTRDGYTCMYCGLQSRHLTLDHVVPKTRGGQTIWTNVVACCTRCNATKGGKSLKEAGMKLMHAPREPRFLPYIRWVKHTKYSSWDKYLFTDSESQYLIYGPLPNQDA